MKKLIDIRLVAIVAVIAALMAVSVSTASTGYIWNGPIETDDLKDGEGISHSSKVRYQKADYPFVAISDKVTYGGRRIKKKAFHYHRTWRLEKVEYKEWDGDSWNEVDKVGTSSWRSTGTPGLAYHDLYRSVTMNGGAAVYHQIKYRWWVHYPLTKGFWVKPVSTVHAHYLE